LQYLSHSPPNVLERVSSSLGAKTREPMYIPKPINTPSQLLNKKNNQGNTRSARPVYSGCLTTRYGPLVISLFLGTLVLISVIHQSQFKRPRIKIIIDIVDKVSVGPLTLNKDGDIILKSIPISIKGRVNNIILSPLPISIFSFNLISLILLKQPV